MKNNYEELIKTNITDENLIETILDSIQEENKKE